jgi:cytochrome c5
LVVVAAMLAAVASAAQAGAGQAHGAPSTTAWNGAFTDAQAARGGERYRTSCAACHAEDLLGATAPALAGQAFLERWNGQTAFDMVQLIKQSMPQEAPDSLGQPVYVDIVAFLLKTNGLPAGTAELPADDAALKQVLVTSRAPTP